MRFSALLALATALAFTGAPAVAADAPEIVRVWTGYRTAESFVRISEYFDGRENPGGQTFLRTRPDSREGFYFLLRTKSPREIAGATVTLQIITPAKPEAVTHTFPATVPAGGHVFQVGLTGADWASPKTQPVAWRLSLRDAAGAELAAEQSFLWARP